jgi:hypothetical protein
MVGMFSSKSSGGIKSIQTFSITIPNNSVNNTTTIAAVDTTKSYIAMGGYQSDSDSVRQSPSVTLTNSTTVTATKNVATGGVIVTGAVVESY